MLCIGFWTCADVWSSLSEQIKSTWKQQINSDSRRKKGSRLFRYLRKSYLRVTYTQMFHPIFFTIIVSLLFILLLYHPELIAMGTIKNISTYMQLLFSWCKCNILQDLAHSAQISRLPFRIWQYLTIDYLQVALQYKCLTRDFGPTWAGLIDLVWIFSETVMGDWAGELRRCWLNFKMM